MCRRRVANRTNSVCCKAERRRSSSRRQPGNPHMRGKEAERCPGTPRRWGQDNSLEAECRSPKGCREVPAMPATAGLRRREGGGGQKAGEALRNPAGGGIGVRRSLGWRRDGGGSS